MTEELAMRERAPRRRYRRTLAALFVSAIAAALVPSPAPAATGTIDASDPTQTGQLTRTLTASSCAAPKTNPGLVPGIVRMFHYDTVTIVNSTGSPECVTVTLSSMTNLFAVAYLGSYDPTSPTTNYLADPGQNTGGGSVMFSFALPAGQTAVVVVTEVTEGSCAAPGNSCPWTLTATTAPVAVTLRTFTATASGTAVTLRWRTASEVATLGYNVYGLFRGKRVRLNSRVIPGKRVTGASYSFTYRPAKARPSPRRYRLEVLNLDGSRTWYSARLRPRA